MTELVLISTADSAALAEEVKRLVAFIDRVPDVPLADIAYTCALEHGPCVLALIVESTAELRNRLSSVLTRLSSPTLKRIKDKSGVYWYQEHLLGEGKGRLAFLYPGVMGYYPDMLRDLAIARPECRRAFDELEEALAGETDFSPSSFVFPPADCYRRDADIYSSGAYAEALVATYAGCVALTRLLVGCGVSPEGVVGFAGGDLAAMIRSGAAGKSPARAERLKVIRDIYSIVRKAVNHGGLPQVAMITVLLRRPGEIDKLVSTFPPEKVILAVDFSPRQKTYAVAADFEAEVLKTFASAGVRTVKLGLDRPFNTPLCANLVPSIRKFATGWMSCEPVYDVYSCATAEKVPKGIKPARDDTAERWARPVRFGETVRRMYEDGYRVFLEVGPRGLLSSAVTDTLRGESFSAIAMNSIHRSGILQVQHAIGQLAALGAPVDISEFYAQRKARKLDFDGVLSLELRKDAEKHLSRAFPCMTYLVGKSDDFPAVSAMVSPTGRGARAAVRAAAIRQNARRQRQFDFGATNPLVSDADTIDSSQGFSLEITKTFRLANLPFIGDYALGTSQVSYSDANLKGLVLLTLPVGAEIMAEVAQQVVPGRVLVTVENLDCRRMIAFRKGELTLFVRGERVPSGDPKLVAVKVLLRDDRPDAAYTWPIMEGTFLFAEESRPPVPVTPSPLAHPRSVHWSGRDIYPLRLSCGHRLRGIRFVEAWSETGVDYEIEVPPLSGNVDFTRLPAWTLNPILLEIITSGFALWRSNGRVAGAFAFPFFMRRLDIRGVIPSEGSRLRCYLRLTGVTPTSHICKIEVSNGNGTSLMSISGWEERADRVPPVYRELILQPANTFLTEPLPPETLGGYSDVSSAFITEVPYPIFERNEGLWLKTLSHVVLASLEREKFADMTSESKRRTEWLFGRIAAKEAVRRYLKDYHQARWADADVKIWADANGKPCALGEWADFLSSKLDIAIAHTSKFIVAVAAANMRAGVDVEYMVRDLSEEFTDGVFTPEEKELAAGAMNAPQTLIRFWCAKEAVSKALGTGIRYSPRELVVKSFEPDSGRLILQLEGAWLEAFKRFRGRDIAVTVKLVREHALATCFLPAALFVEDEDGAEMRNIQEFGEEAAQ